MLLKLKSTEELIQSLPPLRAITHNTTQLAKLKIDDEYFHYLASCDNVPFSLESHLYYDWLCTLVTQTYMSQYHMQMIDQWDQFSESQQKALVVDFERLLSIDTKIATKHERDDEKLKSMQPLPILVRCLLHYGMIRGIGSSAAMSHNVIKRIDDCLHELLPLYHQYNNHSHFDYHSHDTTTTTMISSPTTNSSKDTTSTAGEQQEKKQKQKQQRMHNDFAELRKRFDREDDPLLIHRNLISLLYQSKALLNENDSASSAADLETAGTPVIAQSIAALKEKAVHYYSLAISYSPLYALPRTYRGELLKEDRESSERDLCAAIELDPYLSCAYTYRGNLNVLFYRNAQGVRDFSMAIALQMVQPSMSTTNRSVRQQLEQLRVKLMERNMCLGCESSSSSSSAPMPFDDIDDYGSSIAPYYNRSITFDHMGLIVPALADSRMCLWMKPKNRSYRFNHNDCLNHIKNQSCEAVDLLNLPEHYDDDDEE